MTSLSDGGDVRGQPLRKQTRRHGTPAKRQITPSTGSCQGIKTPGKALGQQAVGATPARRIERLPPVVRGWAKAHRHLRGAATVANRDRLVWRRRYRWAKPRHPEQTGRWITNRYCPHHAGASWRFPDPTSGLQIIRVQEALPLSAPSRLRGTPTRSIRKGRRPANPMIASAPEDHLGIACTDPAPAARMVSHLPTGDPERSAPRMASPGWPPPESTGPSGMPPSPLSPSGSLCTGAPHGIDASCEGRWSGVSGVPGNWLAPF